MTLRRLRHWKQRFDKDATFVWRQARMFNGVMTVPGQLVPEDVRSNTNKLRRLWDANVIELAEFEDLSNSLTGERRQTRKPPKPEDTKATKRPKKPGPADPVDPLDI